MTVTQQGVITLLRSAIAEKSLPLPAEFDLEGALETVQSHHMHALVYDGAVRCGVDKNCPVMKKLLRGYLMALLKSEKQVQAVTELFRIFEENGIDYMPLKGSKMKFLYPKPELRMMGDADILIRTEQYEQIEPLLPALGYHPKHESDHELVWLSDSLYLELHKRLIPSYNEDFYDYYGSGWQLAHPETGHRYTMSAEDEWIFLFTHFSKHFRDGGIGCRHVVDLWVYRNHHPQMDEAYIRAELEKLQLLEFYENICALLAVWFEDAAADSKADVITDYIFASGSWGEALSRTVSIAVRDSRRSQRAREGKWQYALRIMFPDVNTLRGKYTVLQKRPWLLPLVWVVRPFYKLFCEPQSLLRHRKHLRAITDEKVDERRELLRYMGIDYRF